MKLVPVPAHALGQYLPAISWHLQSFAIRSGGKFTVDDLISDLTNSRRQLWLGVDPDIRAVALTQVLADHKDTVSLTHCAGEGAVDWVHLIDGIRAWARDRGSQAFEVTCRPGWEKYLKGHGFKKTHIVMESDIV